MIECTYVQVIECNCFYTNKKEIKALIIGVSKKKKGKSYIININIERRHGCHNLYLHPKGSSWSYFLIKI